MKHQTLSSLMLNSENVNECATERLLMCPEVQIIMTAAVAIEHWPAWVQ